MFGLYRQNNISHVLQICWLHIWCESVIPPQLHYWLKLGDCRDQWVYWPRFHDQESVWNYFSSLTQHIILLKAAVRRWEHRGHKELDIISNTTQAGLQCSYNVQFILKDPKCARTSLHHWQQHELLIHTEFHIFRPNSVIS